MQLTSTIIVALLAVSTSNLTAAKKFPNLRGGVGRGHGVGLGLDKTAHTPLEHVTPTRKLEEKTEISDPPGPILESSTTLDAQQGGCPGTDRRVADSNQKTSFYPYQCPTGQIMCFDVNPLHLFHEHKYYCHVL